MKKLNLIACEIVKCYNLSIRGGNAIIETMKRKQYSKRNKGKSYEKIQEVFMLF